MPGPEAGYSQRGLPWSTATQTRACYASLLSICETNNVSTNTSPRPLSRVQVLMVLKRSGEQANVGGMGLLSSYSFGLCLDFLPSDSSLYLAGTEDGEGIDLHHIYTNTGSVDTLAFRHRWYTQVIRGVLPDALIWSDVHSPRLTHSVVSTSPNDNTTPRHDPQVFRVVQRDVPGDVRGPHRPGVPHPLLALLAARLPQLQVRLFVVCVCGRWCILPCM
jgi:hypothetical protein